MARMRTSRAFPESALQFHDDDNDSGDDDGNGNGTSGEFEHYDSAMVRKVRKVKKVDGRRVQLASSSAQGGPCASISSVDK